MNAKFLIALLGFAGLASLGRAAVVVVDPPCQREVVVRGDWRPVVGRVVYVQAQPPRPRFGRYERVVRLRNDGFREIRYVYVRR